MDSDLNDLKRWLTDNNITNIHRIPPHLKGIYKKKIKHVRIFCPQPGGQENFHKNSADIVVYGGEAGGGKSFSIVYEHVKWLNIPNYEGIIVRKNFSQIFDAGGLWQEAMRVYPHFGGEPVRGDRPMFRFPSGARVVFKHSNHEHNVENIWKGIQSPLITADEITEFSLREFLYMMSRNRSMTKIRPYIRATCNPDPTSFVKDMIKWWIKPDGFIDDSKCGVIRWFVFRNDQFVWADTEAELLKQFGPKCGPKSFTFIRGRLSENKMMGEMVGEGVYEASLQNLSEADKWALSSGNWNLIENPSALFSRKNINQNRIENICHDKLVKVVVGVDPAGSTNKNSDETGIVVCGIDSNKHGYVLEDRSGKYKPAEWAKIVCDLFVSYKADSIVAESNFGGDMVKHTIMTHDSSIIPKMTTSSRGKTARAEPIASLYSSNQISHVGHGLTRLEDEMCNWVPGQESRKKSPNRMDALVFAFNDLIVTQPKKMARIWVG